jgi:hypothetical protein
MHRNVTRIVLGLAFAVLTVGAVGCGAKTYDVNGQVKYNGSTLDKPGGQVVFIAPDGAQVSAPISQDGTYRASKVPAGPNRIAVYYPNPTFQNRPKPKKNEPPVSTGTDELYLTPPKYASADTSELTVQVAQGTVFNIDMTGPAIP